MLKITEAAWERMSELQASRPNVTALRLKQIDGRLKCHSGIEKTDDSVIEHDGCLPVLLEPTLAKRLSGQTLDAPKTARGRRLRLKQNSRS